MKVNQAVLQIGKKGVTSGLMKNIENCFKTHKDVKVCLLKNVGHDKKKAREIAEEIIETLGKKYTYRVLGFTIFLKKWRKEKR
ncbi:MAG TPA: YhbY family RNA-binding protein [Bacillota bacterium]|nr:YhbY family RNA-binding protein [Bacillota bacterium]